jgi:hypothetical protein
MEISTAYRDFPKSAGILFGLGYVDFSTALF